MRDRCCGGGTMVAAAVAVLEEQNVKVNRPFLNTCSAEQLRDSLPYTKEACSPSSSSSNQTYNDKNASSNNDAEGPLHWLDHNPNPPYSNDNTNGAAAQSEIENHFSGMARETRKSKSPTNLHARSKNITSLEEALGGNFSVRNQVNYIDRIVSDRGDFESRDLFDDSSFFSFSIQSADHNFEEAVNDFNLTAEDIQNFVSKYDSSSSKRTSTTEDRDGEDNHQYAIEKGERLSSDYSVDNFDSDSSDVDSSSATDSDSIGEHIINEGLATITEEDRATASSVQSAPEGDSSSQDDESTVKGNAVWSGTTSNRESSSELSSCSSTHSKTLKDSSTRCNDDFQWIRKDPIEMSIQKMDQQLPQTKPPINRSLRERSSRRSSERERAAAPGSLDRRRHHQNRQERDQKARSSHILKSPPKCDDYASTQSCQNWCCNPHPNEQYCFDNFHRRHERVDPQRYGSSPMLMDQRFVDRGSHPDLYNEFGRFRHEQPYGCCSYHTAPPCCFFSDARSYHWPPPSYSLNKGSDHDDKLRKLQSEKDNLQLQVQVLTEQIEAQGDKITDLEKVLIERKQQLTNSEDMLQREMLSRSSLETQKLELMSAISEMKLHQAALERENLELRSSRFNNNGISGTKPPVRARPSPQPHHSTPVHHNSNPGINVRMSPSPSPVPTGAMISQSPRKIESNSPVQDLAQPPKTPPANYRRQIDIHYGSLPRQQFISNGEIVPVTDTNANTANNSRKGVAFAETEKIIIDENSDGTPSSPSLQFNKNKGIKKIFGRMRRSGSGNLEDIPGLSEFQRGGVRATAAARLGWSEPLILTKPDKPFPEWDTENICDWLQDLGLEQYISEAKRWIKNGQQLQEVPIQEIEKELGIRNVLHRKKLQLAIADSLENGSSDPYLEKAGKLDTAWVLRWLDDSGLPQHKEAFLINRIDGRVLHRLTVDDLSVLHVTSLLHVASLKRGIQVLRENDFEPGCLQRRSLPDDPEQPTPKQICLWTTHRVMEWLRAVDLAEYAPNLRGAGVHGGLMVLEDKFTSELLATLLNIPPGKTLLRRHLNTHFKELLGKDIIQEKRESEGTLGYIPLTPSAKLKVTKKSQFSLKRKKSKGEVDYGDLVCPLNPNCEGEMNGSIRSSMGIKRVEEVKEEAVSLLSDDGSLTDSFSQSPCVSPLPDRHLV
ncbi:uncharacterized protein LOC116169452 isoform X2 [Photinus pyralis]|uniref:SAM domain-containing protein n=1 Tax=Photinus pyralis TaxID=7054 RepID=A0A1Y1LBE8_PHOPY|nr:uncharacterized protein LOC116169452 isoform X2 [Photinus pyralis]